MNISWGERNSVLPNVLCSPPASYLPDTDQRREKPSRCLSKHCLSDEPRSCSQLDTGLSKQRWLRGQTWGQGWGGDDPEEWWRFTYAANSRPILTFTQSNPAYRKHIMRLSLCGFLASFSQQKRRTKRRNFNVMRKLRSNLNLLVYWEKVTLQERWPAVSHLQWRKFKGKRG